jgi:hypothetical protein
MALLVWSVLLLVGAPALILAVARGASRLGGRRPRPR